MNRTDRLLAIVLELQRHRRSYCRAEDLATRFEVSKRTIYRDIQALCEAGVPITVADRQGYALVDGYFLPPLSFTTDEALILALGSDFMAHNFDHDYRIAAHSAYRKVDAVLPPLLRTQVDHLKSGLHFLPHNDWTMTGSRRFGSFARRLPSTSASACSTSNATWRRTRQCERFARSIPIT
jgi:predicted DNA-binding transcriptional regulator YafY